MASREYYLLVASHEQIIIEMVPAPRNGQPRFGWKDGTSTLESSAMQDRKRKKHEHSMRNHVGKIKDLSGRSINRMVWCGIDGRFVRSSEKLQVQVVENRLCHFTGPQLFFACLVEVCCSHECDRRNCGGQAPTSAVLFLAAKRALVLLGLDMESSVVEVFEVFLDQNIEVCV